LRCSLSDNKGRTSGSPLLKAMNDPEADTWVRQCMQTWLSKPNPRLRLVLLTGITSGYMLRVLKRLCHLHPATYRPLSKSAAVAAGVTWVFTQHPSKICENHYINWLDKDIHAKRAEAKKRIAIALTRLDPPA
jgi:hypothetical protein